MGDFLPPNEWHPAVWPRPVMTNVDRKVSWAAVRLAMRVLDAYSGRRGNFWAGVYGADEAQLAQLILDQAELYGVSDERRSADRPLSG